MSVSAKGSFVRAWVLHMLISDVLADKKLRVAWFLFKMDNCDRKQILSLPKDLILFFFLTAELPL